MKSIRLYFQNILRDVIITSWNFWSTMKPSPTNKFPISSNEFIFKRGIKQSLRVGNYLKFLTNIMWILWKIHLEKSGNIFETEQGTELMKQSFLGHSSISSISPFQPSVTFRIETGHLICSTNQLTGFYTHFNTGLKSVIRNPSIQHLTYGNEICVMTPSEILKFLKEIDIKRTVVFHMIPPKLFKKPA